MTEAKSDEGVEEPDPAPTGEGAAPSPGVPRVVWTLAGLAIYQLLRLVPLPNLSASAVEVLETGSLAALGGASIVALGLGPFLSGFLIVELFSLVTPWGRRARMDGTEGRQALTRWSMKVSLFVAILQGMALVAALGQTTTLYDEGLLASQGLVPRLFTALTLVATAFGVYALASLMTRRGVGNGFCLLFLSDPLVEIVSAWLDPATRTYGAIPWPFVHGILAVLVVGFLVHRFLGQAPALSEASASASKDWPLPSFPQGLVPATWALAWLHFLGAGWITVRGEALGPIAPGSPLALVILLASVPFLSLVTVHFFSSRGRLVSNLPGVAIPEDFDSRLNRRFFGATAILTLLVLGLSVLEGFTQWSAVLDVLVLVGLAAVVADLVDEWRLRQRHAGVVELATLDNVQLGLVLRSHLRGRGIDCSVQALHFRSLFFFFGPLYKMEVLVPEAQVAEAETLWAELDPRVV